MNYKENIEEEKTEIKPEEIFSPEFKSCCFTIGDKEFSIDIKNLKEIIEPLDIFPVPLSPSYLKGLLVLRGDAIPVVDLSLIYDAHHSDNPNKNMIICDSDDGSICFLCDDMPDLQTHFRGTIIDIERIFDQYSVKE